MDGDMFTKISEEIIFGVFHTATEVNERFTLRSGESHNEIAVVGLLAVLDSGADVSKSQSTILHREGECDIKEGSLLEFLCHDDYLR
jgi:hypothetical protein